MKKLSLISIVTAIILCVAFAYVSERNFKNFLNNSEKCSAEFIDEAFLKIIDSENATPAYLGLIIKQKHPHHGLFSATKIRVLHSRAIKAPRKTVIPVLCALKTSVTYNDLYTYKALSIEELLTVLKNETIIYNNNNVSQSEGICLIAMGTPIVIENDIFKPKNKLQLNCFDKETRMKFYNNFWQ